ncbi:PKD domain-containing protein [Cryomorphaceae bacterium 1068]|nr:PKD domain-containing protein [Cryomorphaceae bacterium 1068]
MSPIEALKAHHDSAHAYSGETPSVPLFGFSWKFIGHNMAAAANGEGQTGPLRNYFFGSPDQWVSGVKDVKQVRKTEVYPGIDVLYKLHPRNQLEYDFIVAPNADPSLIKWEWSGIEAKIAGDELVFETPYGWVKEIIPEAYQIISGKKVPVEVSFQKLDRGFGFSVAEYDENFTLVIDPLLVGATLTGSTGDNNYGHGAAYDQEGNIFSFGIGFGPGLPTSDGALQESFEGGGGGVNAVINKFTPDASEQIYATYLGGGGTYPHSASANLSGELVVFGTTGDQNFPTTPGAFQEESAGGTDIFISRLSDDGTELIASTYLGGEGLDGNNPIFLFGYDGLRGEVSLDSEGNVYLASATQSDDFPVTSGAFSTTLDGTADGVCAKLSSDLTVLFWSTFIGGSESDALLNVRIAENGNVVFSGATGSSDYPTTAGVYQEGEPGDATDVDAILGTLSPDGSDLIYSTYVGTSQGEQGYFMDLDNDNNVWIYGRTQAGDEWPITDGVFTTDFKELFITKFNPQLSEVLASTAIGAEGIFGGGGGGAPVAFLIDRCDRVYISAFQAAADLPLTDDALFDNGSFYLAAFIDDLDSLAYATYYSGAHVDGGTSRFDKSGIVYQGVCSSSAGIATTDGAYAEDQFTSWDIGVFKIDFELSGVNAAFNAPSELDGCAPHEISFSNFSIGDTFEWDFGDGTGSTEFEPVHIFEEPGTYTVSMIASDSLSCNLADTVSLNIDIFAPEDFQPTFDTSIDCETGEVTMFNTTGGNDFLDFFWIINGDTLYTSYNASHQFANLDLTNTVALYAVDEGCELDETVVEEITNLADVTAEIGNTFDTECGLSIELLNASANATEFLWAFGDGETSAIFSPTHVYDDYGTYTITLTAINPSTCNVQDEASITIEFIEPPAIDGTMTLNQTGVCGELILEGELDNTAGMASYTWFVSGDEVGTETSFVFDADFSGLYTVEAEIIPIGCNNPFTISDTITLVSELPLDFGPDRDICHNATSVTLENEYDLAEASYLWQPTGATSPDLVVTEPGVYVVQVQTGLCSDSRSIEIGLGVEETTSFETEICEGVGERITVAVNHQEFFWENGLTGNSIVVTRGGMYNYMYIDNGGCEQIGQYVVEGLEPEPIVYIPNTFSPNGDGINDLFKISTSDSELDDYLFSVYNRWGELMFETTDPSQGWNGAANGSDYFVPPGVYPYYVKYSGICQSETLEEKGFVTLIR